MTYEEKAEVFTKAFARTGSVARALRLVDRMQRRQPPGSRRLTAEQLAGLRARRAAGEKLASLGHDYGVTDSQVSRLCRGLRRPPKAVQRARAIPPMAADLIREVGRELDLTPGWERLRQQGGVGGGLSLGYRAVVLAMREAGLTHHEVAMLMGRHHSSIVKQLPVALRDPEACRLAALVAQRLAAAGAQPAAAQAA
jgi:hypothetical protein